MLRAQIISMIQLVSLFAWLLFIFESCVLMLIEGIAKLDNQVIQLLDLLQKHLQRKYFNIIKQTNKLHQNKAKSKQKNTIKIKE